MGMSLADNKNWETIQKVLQAEASGKAPHLFSSQRTLFGIPSELDRELEAFVLENDAIDKEESGNADEGGDAKESEAAVHTESNSRTARTASNEPALVKHPLQPVFDEDSRVLILGTMPSPKSRETGFYYNHPQNRFWPVLSQILDEALPTSNEEKRALVLKHHIALWDVLASCQIEGAKDVSIAQCVPNDLLTITTKAPIRAIFCTGAKATELYDRYCKDRTGIDCIRLPSTSPANAACSLDALVKAYRQILPYLE